MIYFSGLVGFLLVLSIEARLGNSSALYNLICVTQDYEVRQYGSVKWASVNVTAHSLDSALTDGLHQLHDYINGGNVNGTKIEIASPTIVKMPGNDSLEMGRYVVSVLLSDEYQPDPPTPTDDMVYILETPIMTVFVLGFDGGMNDASHQNMSSTLSVRLDSFGVKFRKDFSYAATYSRLMMDTNGRMEVWYVAVEQQWSSSSSSSEEDIIFSFC